MIDPARSSPAFHSYHARGDDAQANHLMKERLSRDVWENICTRPSSHREAISVFQSKATEQICLATAERVQVLMGEGKATLAMPWLTRRQVHQEPAVSNREPNCNNSLVKTIQNASSPAGGRQHPGVYNWPTRQASYATSEQQYVVQRQSTTSAGSTESAYYPKCERLVDRAARDVIDMLDSDASGERCQRCLDTCLIVAVRSGSHQKVLNQLSQGADPDFAGGIALLEAMRARRAELVMSIVSGGPKKPSSDTVDRVMGAIYKEGDGEGYFRTEQDIVKTCLQAAPRGPAAQQTLSLAIRYESLEVIDIFTACRQPVSGDYCTVLKTAIMTQEPRVLGAVLRGTPGNATLTAATAQIFQLRDPQVMGKMFRLLVAAGLQGSVMSDALERTLKHLQRFCPDGTRNADVYYELVRFLLGEGGADVNALSNEPLAICVQLSSPELRLRLVDLFLRAGACGPAVGEALSLSAELGETGINLTSILLQRSSVDFKGGKPLLNAVRSRCIQQTKLLLDSRPSGNTLYNGWNQVMESEDDTFRLEALQLFMSYYTVLPFLDEALAKAVTLNDRGLSICELMIKHGASAERLDGKAISEAAKYQNISALELFGSLGSNAVLYTKAFEALTVNDAWLTEAGLKVASFLLDHGAAGRVVETAFCVAARFGNVDAFELLKMDSFTSETWERAFVSVMSGSEWLSPSLSYLQIVDSLLRSGISAEATNDAFVSAVSAIAEGRGCDEDILETLIKVGRGVDVNYGEAKALRIAVRHRHEELFVRLFSLGRRDITLKSRTSVLSEAILAPLDGKVVLGLVEAVTEGVETLPDLKEQLQWDGLAPIAACMKHYPTSTRLVERLAQLGCNMEAETCAFVYDDECVEAEPVPPLLWALSRPEEHQIPSKTIKALLDLKVNVNAKAPKSHATALMLAAKHGRTDLVTELIERRAVVSNLDRFDRSALFYAAREGHLASVRALHKTNEILVTTDGSLHEAARQLHSHVVHYLLKAGHEPKFRSSNPQHEGRLALEELALKTKASEGDLPELKKTISLLTKRNPSYFLDALDKNALFLALDNSDPYTVTRALLDTVAGDLINDPKNTYEEFSEQEKTIYFRSPTIYIEHKRCASHWSHHDGLLRLLWDKQCPDRFYAERGKPQPPGALGFPPEIEMEVHKAERARRRSEVREKERQEKMARQEELHEEEHQMKMMRQKEILKLQRKERLKTKRMEESLRHGHRFAAIVFSQAVQAVARFR